MTIEKLGAVLFSADAWMRLQSVAANVPDARHILPSNGRAIRDAWIVGPHRPKGEHRFRDWVHRRLLAADSLDRSDAVSLVHYWLSWFESRASVVIDGSITGIQDSGAVVENLYFDGPGAEDWPGLARVDDRFLPLLGPSHVFVPNG